MLAMHLAQWVTNGLRTDASSRLLVVAHAVDDGICCSGYTVYVYTQDDDVAAAQDMCSTCLWYHMLDSSGANRLAANSLCRALWLPSMLHVPALCHTVVRPEWPAPLKDACREDLE